jgi:hypothetical protein
LSIVEDSETDGELEGEHSDCGNTTAKVPDVELPSLAQVAEMKEDLCREEESVASPNYEEEGFSCSEEEAVAVEKLPLDKDQAAKSNKELSSEQEDEAPQKSKEERSSESENETVGKYENNLQLNDQTTKVQKDVSPDQETEAIQNSEEVSEKGSLPLDKTAETARLDEHSSSEKEDDTAGEAEENLRPDGSIDAASDLASSSEFGKTENALPPTTEEQVAGPEPNEDKILKTSEVKKRSESSTSLNSFLSCAPGDESDLLKEKMIPMMLRFVRWMAIAQGAHVSFPNIFE